MQYDDGQGYRVTFRIVMIVIYCWVFRKYLSIEFKNK